MAPAMFNRVFVRFEQWQLTTGEVSRGTSHATTTGIKQKFQKDMKLKRSTQYSAPLLGLQWVLLGDQVKSHLGQECKS